MLGYRSPLAALVRAVCLALAIPAAAAQQAPEPEQRLVSAVDAMRSGEFDTALSELERLVDERPTFRLAQLLYGQLLAARSGQPQVPAANDPQMAELLDEARARLQLWQQGVPDGARPDAILQLPRHVHHALLVDLSRMRLFVLRNDDGTPQVVRHYYAAIGKAGYGKQERGDMRTPVGVYRITQWLPGSGLPELYGIGAFPVDYPNAWDRLRGRTGSGIWLHGVPPDTYARPPRSSEGCVTLANEDLASLREFVVPGLTPVVLADRVQWLEPAQAEAERQELLAHIEDWRRRWAAIDTEGYLAYYAPDFTTPGMDRARFAAHKRRVNAAKRRIELSLQELELYRYPGESGLYLARFVQDYRSDNFRSRSRKEQYWRRSPDGRWEIVREHTSR